MIPLQTLRDELRLGNVQKDDDLVLRYEAGAVAYLERETGWYFGDPKTFTQDWRGEPLRWRPQGPVTVETNATEDDEDAWRTLEPTEFTVTGRIVVVNPYATRWPARWRVSYPIGFAEEDVPADVREVVIMLVQHRYEARTKGEPGAIPEALGELVQKLAAGLRSIV